MRQRLDINERVLFYSDNPIYGSFPFNRITKLVSSSEFRRNKRSSDYMLALLKEKFSVQEPKFINPAKMKKNSHRPVAIIWNDSNGHGWFLIELSLLLKKNKSIKVINGRGRIFEFNFKNMLSVWLRRAMEKCWVLEILFIPFFFIVTPFLLVYDFIRGKK